MIEDEDNEYLVLFDGCCALEVQIKGNLYDGMQEFDLNVIEPYLESWSRHCWTWNSATNFKVKYLTSD